MTGSNTKHASNGIGTSMNLINAASKFINCDMAIIGHFTSRAQTTVAGSYQHAWVDISLNQSLNYTFNSAGIGGVFNYPVSIRASYSNFQGDTFTFTPLLMK